MARNSTEAAYPKAEEDRILFWERQLAYAIQRMEPFWMVGDKLKKIYLNQAANIREKARELTDGTEDLGPMRVKAGVVFAWIDQTIANMLERNPTFKVTPANEMGAQGTPVVESSANYWYEETNQFFHDRRSLLDAFLYPYASKKIGWNARFLERDEFDLTDISDIVIDEPAEAAAFLAIGTPLAVGEYQNHAAHIEAAVSVLQDPLVDDYIKESVVQPYIDAHQRMMERPQPDNDVSMQYDAPYGVRWRPRDFVIDPFAENGLLDAQWIAFRWRRRLIDAQSNPNYDNTGDLEPNTEERPLDAPEMRLEDLGYDDFGFVCGWEIYARNFPVGRRRRENLLITLVPGHDKFLQHTDWPFSFLEDYPAEILAFQQGIDTWTCDTTIHLAGGDNIQSLINEFYDSMLSVIRKQKNVFLFDKDMFEEEDIEEILQLPEGSARRVEGLAQAQGRAVQAIPFQQIPEDKMVLSRLLNDVFDRTMGTPQPIRQATPDTATEAAIIERRTTAREELRANLFKAFQVNTARKFWQLHQQFLPDRQFQIDPRTHAVAAVTEEIAKGEYRFRVDISSRAVAQSVELDRWMRMLNLAVGIAPTLMQLGFQPPNLMEIFKRLLQRGFGLQDVEAILPGMEPDPLLVQSLQDPAQRQLIIEALSKFRGGGNMVTGGGPGPANPQEFAAQGQTEADEFTRANRI